MTKKYHDRAMGSASAEEVVEFVPSKGQYFFPKAKGGPIVIDADSREEAEVLPAMLNNK